MADNSVTATVHYLSRKELYKTIKPYFCYVPPDTLNGFPITNQDHTPINIVIKDIRQTNWKDDHEAFSLEKNGFEVVKHDLPPEYNFDAMQNDTSLVDKYVSDIESLLKVKLGATRVTVFDYELRRRNPEFPGGIGKESSMRQPVRGVHVDSSPASAMEKAVSHCSNPADQHLLSGRIQIVNTWRPLFTPLCDWPLALCDSRSVSLTNDLIPCDSVYPTKLMETLQVFDNPDHEWWFLREQTTEELLLFKIFDSSEENARFCPHASFDLDDKGGARPRESVETRALVFYEA